MISSGPISRRLTSIMRTEEVLSQKRVSSTPEIKIRLAVSEEDFTAAYHLIYKQYVEYGYMDRNPAEMRIDYWNLLPNTYTIVAEKDGEIIGTVSHIVDSGANLPMSEVASAALDDLRLKGRRFCEVSGLSIDKEQATNETVLMMIRYGVHLSREHLNIDSYVITVNPRHEKFYKKLMYFEQIAETVSYKKVKQAPGVPMFLDLTTQEQTYFEKHGHRRGNRNIYRSWFVDGIDKLKRDIARDVELRNQRVNLSFVRRMASKVPGLLESTRQRELLACAWSNDEEVTTTVA